MKLKEILVLDFSEDIKKVIDLEDQAESEIKYEIDNYIITPKIAEYFSKFVKVYKSNIKESGVWISGFYGSGKSYFGKNLGHILSNKSILGTTVRERFIQRLAGLKNASLLENDIRSLDSLKSKVVFMDIAKQHTGDGGLSWTLFKNFIKSFGFLDNYIGYIEYSLYLKDEYNWFLEEVKRVEGKEWTEVKTDPYAPIIFRRIMTKEKFNEAEYNEFKASIDFTIQNFDAAKLREMLQLYLKKFPEERIVFILDETSEAVSQKKITLLDLEGLSEAISSLKQSVWTIAIAQQKLDEVITNTGVNLSALTKVTDRFKTQIHLESTDVELIVNERLLKKKDSAVKKLEEYYNQNIGRIGDFTKLQASFVTSTENVNEFVTYYPFHKYQFRLLQNFLFKSNILAKSQVAERGMIITTFDVLRNKLVEKSLYNFASCFDITSEGQLNPPIEISRRYSKARTRLEEIGSNLKGDDILKVIHFLTESENEAQATLENIIKCYVEDFGDDLYKIKKNFEDALNDLVDVNILIEDNNVYKIATDQEQKISTEIKSIPIGEFKQKTYITKQLKNFSIIKSLANVSLDGISFSFSVQTDTDDDLVSTSNKYLQVKVYNLKVVKENWSTQVENLKAESYKNKNFIHIVPSNNQVSEIENLITEVMQFDEIESRYSGDHDSDVRKIIKQFNSITSNKRSKVDQMILDSYQNGVVIYNGEENNLKETDFKQKLNELQKKLIDNIYPKRLKSNVNEDVAKFIIKERHQQNLIAPFNNLGSDFHFFDKNGGFVGEHLKVVEEITSRISKTFIDGKALEADLEVPPCGYNFGIVCTTLAVLFRAGKLIVKINGEERYDFLDNEAQKVFISSRDFQKAQFKAITKTISAASKNEMVQELQKLKAKELIDKKIDYSTNDFELVDAITLIAVSYIDKLAWLNKSTNGFEDYFSDYKSLIHFFKEYADKTTESNYILKSEIFVKHKDEFITNVKRVNSIENFVQKKLPSAELYNKFVNDVLLELNKCGGTYKNEKIISEAAEFESHIKNNIANKFTEIQNLAQSIKDNYYKVFESEHQKMHELYSDLIKKAKEIETIISQAPSDLNKDLKTKIEDQIEFIEKRICNNFLLEYDTKCKSCSFTMYESLSSAEAIQLKEKSLIDIENSIIIEETNDEPKKSYKKVKMKIKKGVVSVKTYKDQLNNQLKEIEQMNDNESIDLDVEVE